MPTHHPIPPGRLRVARVHLSRFVKRRAAEVTELVGFTFAACPDAPSTIGQVVDEFQRCRLSGEPYRVSSLFCENTLFVSPIDNQLFRFWHDVCHANMGFTFDIEDELMLATHHLDVLRAHRFAHDSLEHKLFHADTVGQNLCLAETGNFPVNQLRFAVNSATFGLRPAIQIESAYIEAAKATQAGAA